MASKLTPKIHIQKVHVRFKLLITTLEKSILIHFLTGHSEITKSEFRRRQGFLTQDLCFPLGIIEGNARI